MENTIVGLSLVHYPMINFAMQQNHVPLIRSMVVSNLSENDLSEIELVITVDPEIAAPLIRKIDYIPKGEGLDFGTINLILTTQYLRELTEQISGTLSVVIKDKVQEYFSETYTIDFLAYGQWLDYYAVLGLSDAQKQALIFIREVGAIDNHTYRQMADCDILKASVELRMLKNAELVDSKGKGKATYYVSGAKLIPLIIENNTHGSDINTHGSGVNTHGSDLFKQPLILDIPSVLQAEILQLRKREQDPKKIQAIILKICSIRPMKSEELAIIFQKREDYIRKKYLTPLLEQNKIKYLYPEMLKHPDQAYLTNP